MKICPRCGLQHHPLVATCPRCNYHFDSWVSRHLVLVVLVALAVVVIGGYLAVHSHHYGDCLHAPGLLNWPSSCPA